MTKTLRHRMVPRGGIEPPTQGFSEYCSTKNACKYMLCEGIKISVRKNVRYELRNTYSINKGFIGLRCKIGNLVISFKNEENFKDFQEMGIF